MPKPRIHRLGALQLKIMKVLWERGEAPVAEVHDTLSAETELAYTTIATMLRKMEARGLLQHRVEGRTFIYGAAVAEEAVTRSMAEDLLERVFEGSLADMVAHLLNRREISPDELAELERLIKERRKKK
jgi:BlaI family transcriptional regulator, penicillinase repressor